MKNPKIKEKKVEIKLQNLPKNFQWKVLSALTMDLRATLVDMLLPTAVTDAFSAFWTEVDHAIRHRDIRALLAACANIESRCIFELTSGTRANALLFYVVAQIKSFLKKYPFKGHNTKDEAITKFISAEHQCRLFNTVNYRSALTLSQRSPDHYSMVEDIRFDIERLLGESPDMECLLSQAKHGPGVSLSDAYKGGCCTSFYKWSILPYSVTSGAYHHAKFAIESDPRWVGALDDWYRMKNDLPIGVPIDLPDFWRSVFSIQDSSRLTTVPKSFDIDRTIAIEPVFNVFLQLGVDGLIRSKLKKRWGIDIDDQSKNQRLALEGSLTGNLATLDLSSASDTVSLKLCEMILPPAWYNLLLDLRCNVTRIGKDELTLEKISSMGNGYTFALETLIFAAIVRRAKNYDSTIYSVYGDDIIVDTRHYKRTVDYLNLFGFTVNNSKSFSSGPFRESCGADYFKGINVRPIALKKKIVNVPDVLYLHNMFFVKEKSAEWTWELTFPRTLRVLRSVIPAFFLSQVTGPPGESLDTYVFSDNPVLIGTKFGYRKGKALICKAKVFRSRYENFFFQKLMVSLRGEPQKTEPFNKVGRGASRPINNGNAFLITRRGKTTYSVVEVHHWN